MSGGHFDYNQYKINDITNELEKVINKNGKLRKKEDLYYSEEFYKEFPDEKYYYKYPKEVITEFKKGLKILKQASIYTQRIDWFLSGDDGEETFLERLEKELKELENESK